MKNRKTSFLAPKSLALLAFLVFSPMFLYAQDPFTAVGGTFDDFEEMVKKIAPILIFATFIIGAAINLGKVWGENRDWQAFGKSVLIFVIAVTAVLAVATWLATLSFG